MADVVQQMQVVVVALRRSEWRLQESDAAALVFRKVRCFRSLFRAAFGTTYRDDRLQGKLQLPQDLLRGSSLAISEIATRLGYASRRKFEQAFKKRFGQTPALFRRLSEEFRQKNTRIAAQGPSNSRFPL